MKVLFSIKREFYINLMTFKCDLEIALQMQDFCMVFLICRHLWFYITKFAIILSVCLNGWVTLDLNVHFISWKLKLNLALFCNDFKIKTRIKNKFFFFDNLFLSISIKSILFLFLLFFYWKFIGSYFDFDMLCVQL